MPSLYRAAMIALAFTVIAPSWAHSQTAPVAFGGIRADSSLPVEVTADQLNVDQTDGTALFTGNVVIIQGEMRLAAPRVLVEYGTKDRSRIESLHATGGVTLVSGAEAAEAEEALYTIVSGEVVMTGNVFLTQGESTLSGQVLVVDLDTGTGQMEGRVRTVLQPGGN